MAMTIVESHAITGGVDTHLDVHVAAALDEMGGLLGVEQFPTTPAGYKALLAWLSDFGPVVCVGVEGTGSYGAGLTRHMQRSGISVVEVNRPDRQERRRQGKSDPLDAISAGRAVQSGRARALPNGRDGDVEAIRTLLVAKRSARRNKASAINQLRCVVATGPDDLRERFGGHSITRLVTQTAALCPRSSDNVSYATAVTLRELGRRAKFLAHEMARLDKLIVVLVTARGGALLELFGVGPDTAAILLVAAGDNPERLRSEAAWAQLCGVAPIPASSGKIIRRRFNPGGDRQANHALWRIVFVRMRSDPRTQAYVKRRSTEGKSKPEIMRCLKRYVAREVYPYLRGID
jgi:transposase